VDDGYFGAPFVDVDEWRDEPVRHRYVHGGFENTDTRFSFYLPPPEQYEGRFLQWLEGGYAGNENTAQSPMSLGLGLIAFAASCGAYLVESNQGHIASEPDRPLPDNDVLAYGASAQSARYGRELAAEMYGSAPGHGYVFGISGGGLRSISCIEHVDDVWDAAVPCAIPFAAMFYGMAAGAARVLADTVRDIVDATDVGGRGNPFDGLTHEQRTILGQLYRAGYARGAEFMLLPEYALLGGPAAMKVWDPDYFVAFWSEPGYLGHDEPELFTPHVVRAQASVARMVSGNDLVAALGGIENVPPILLQTAMRTDFDEPIAVEIDGIDAESIARLTWSTVKVESGAAAGRELMCSAVMGSIVTFEAPGGGALYDGFAEGDTLSFDNRDRLANDYAFLYHAALEADRFPEFHFELQQFTVDGNTTYPRRDAMSFADTVSARPYLHSFPGRRMFLVQNALDGTNWPVHAENYARRLRDALGDAVEDSFRLYWVDRAAHAPAVWYPPGPAPVTQTRVIDYGGVLRQAVRDLIEWVEHGQEPQPGSGYVYTSDMRLVLDDDAKSRRGLQPVVHAAANGAERAEVRVGEPVELSAVLEAPPGAGTIVGATWDFDGTATWPLRHDDIDGSETRVEVVTTHVYDAPGTYFPAMLASMHRGGDTEDHFYRCDNIGRVRVVVR
jgi:hypothetical protein